MDDTDRATEREENARADALRERKPAGPEATGQCLNCERPLAPGLRWCDSECRDEWQEFCQ
jgi:hypothetical protein